MAAVAGCCTGSCCCSPLMLRAGPPPPTPPPCVAAVETEVARDGRALLPAREKRELPALVAAPALGFLAVSTAISSRNVQPSGRDTCGGPGTEHHNLHSRRAFQCTTATSHTLIGLESTVSPHTQRTSRVSPPSWVLPPPPPAPPALPPAPASLEVDLKVARRRKCPPDDTRAFTCRLQASKQAGREGRTDEKARRYGECLGGEPCHS